MKSFKEFIGEGSKNVITVGPITVAMDGEGKGWGSVVKGSTKGKIPFTYYYKRDEYEYLDIPVKKGTKVYVDKIYGTEGKISGIKLGDNELKAVFKVLPKMSKEEIKAFNRAINTSDSDFTSTEVDFSKSIDNKVFFKGWKDQIATALKNDIKEGSCSYGIMGDYYPEIYGSAFIQLGGQSSDLPKAIIRLTFPTPVYGKCAKENNPKVFELFELIKKNFKKVMSSYGKVELDNNNLDETSHNVELDSSYVIEKAKLKKLLDSTLNKVLIDSAKELK